MKISAALEMVFAQPGKTACELAKIHGVWPDQLSSILNKLSKERRVFRLKQWGMRGRRPLAWRYYPSVDIEKQEAVCSALHALIEAHQTCSHNAKNATRGYTFNTAAVGSALSGIMKTFGKGVVEIQ